MLKHNYSYLLGQSKLESFISIFHTRCNDLHFPFLFFDFSSSILRFSIFFHLYFSFFFFDLIFRKTLIFPPWSGQTPMSTLPFASYHSIWNFSFIFNFIMHFQEEEYKHLKHIKYYLHSPLPSLIFKSTTYSQAWGGRTKTFIRKNKDTKVASSLSLTRNFSWFF